MVSSDSIIKLEMVPVIILVSYIALALSSYQWSDLNIIFVQLYYFLLVVSYLSNNGVSVLLSTLNVGCASATSLDIIVVAL